MFKFMNKLVRVVKRINTEVNTHFNAASSLNVEEINKEKRQKENDENFKAKDKFNEPAFRNHGEAVKMFNRTMVMAAGIQFVLDVKNKKGIKRILVNQTAAPVIVLGYNLYHSTEARRVVKGYLNK